MHNDISSNDIVRAGSKAKLVILRKKLYFFNTYDAKIIFLSKSWVVPGQAVLNGFLQVAQKYSVPEFVPLIVETLIV